MSKEFKDDLFSEDIVNLEKHFNKTDLPSEIFHMHASRSGPLLANELYLAIKEKNRNPKLKLIRGLLQPNGSVAKYLKYWLTGLSDSLQSEIIKKVKLNGVNICNGGYLHENILNSNADSVYGNWSELIEALFNPIFKEFQSDLAKCGFSDKDMLSLILLKGNTLVSLETALNDISLSVLNMILHKKNLPIYEILKFMPNQIYNLEIKYVQRQKNLIQYRYLLEKKINQYKSAYNTIFKILKSYSNKFPNESQLDQVILKSYRIDPSFESLGISRLEIKNSFISKVKNQKITPTFMEQILASIKAHQRSITEQVMENTDDIYIDGANMVKAMFTIANSNNYFLILQEFIRDSKYKLYHEQLKLYKNVNCNISSCKIWDLSQFPEFDQNFVKGLKYLNI